MLFMILHICNHYENNQYNGWAFSALQVWQMAFKGKMNKIKGTTSDSGNIWSPMFLHLASSTSLKLRWTQGKYCFLYIYILPYPYIYDLARWLFSPIQRSHSDEFVLSLSITSMYEYKYLAYRFILNGIFLGYTCYLAISSWPLSPL